MNAYYNENDKYAAQWLRNLIEAGHIAPGFVDERSIEDVRPEELMGYTQCHFFAGIGVWSHSLRQAGWPDDRPVWTGSCPCQPFSAAGKGAGFTDERHLWPAWFHLIGQCKPPVIFGEQVASKDGYAWLDLVWDDMEALGYAFGPHVSPAAGFGAPHIRQRLYFVANPEHQRGEGRLSGYGEKPCEKVCGSQSDDARYGATSFVANPNSDGCCKRREVRSLCAQHDSQYGLPESGMAHPTFERRGQAGCDAESDREARNGWTGNRNGDGSAYDIPPRLGEPARTSPTNGFWRAADWVFCRDGKWRSVEPGTQPLVDVSPARVGRLRAYGNAIVAAQAKEIITAYTEARHAG